ncbi:Gfo/Idh/MocA family protein [Paenibacillus eucommiae]|uniref:Virulence factor n=1 Tax=Paenibacillus eucommiae TaxID=1355755 RepID=A0ABS4J8F7_9BACL|nr:Gfo/Idh/MocA family oxidoreductase [Paenibacillus eucommiae]MBP1996090.1 virulence factor [Paenibacillus eucommiae]
MRKPRVGIVGLGDIAQKVYLPILSKEDNWSLVGAFTPNEAKRKNICTKYRIADFNSIHDLSKECDAIFIHSSTSSHFELVSYFLSNGKDVYVDKPLAATLKEAEKLVELSHKHKRKLMVGFNRRFAPMYVKAKQLSTETAWVRIEKYRNDKINAAHYADTLLDGYIHLVDTARWIGGGNLAVNSGNVQANETNNLVYAQHSFRAEHDPRVQLFTGMHRKAGTGLELLEIVGMDKIVRVKDLHTCEIEEKGKVTTSTSGSWDTILKEKGFEAAVAHFIASIEGDTAPSIDGLEALKTQQLLMRLLQ